MENTFQQGQADSLCGLYALLHFLDRNDNWRAARYREKDDQYTTMWYLLDACQRFGWLTPHTITGGFCDYQLKAIFDTQIQDARLPLKSIYLDDLRQHLSLKNNTNVVDWIMRNDGYAIVYLDCNRDHWILLEPVNAEPLVVDSYKSYPSKMRDWREHFGGVGFGVLPSKRPLIELG